MVWYVQVDSIIRTPLGSDWHPRAFWCGAVPNLTNPISQQDYFTQSWWSSFGFWLWGGSVSVHQRIFLYVPKIKIKGLCLPGKHITSNAQQELACSDAFSPSALIPLPWVHLNSSHVLIWVMQHKWWEWTLGVSTAVKANSIAQGPIKLR